MARPRSELGPYAAVRGTYWRDAGTRGKSLAASGLWVRVNSMCAQDKNDGRFHRLMLHTIFLDQPINEALVSELVDGGWWERDGDYIVVQAYTKHNPSAEELEDSAASARNRKAEYRSKVVANQNPVPTLSHGTTKTLSHGTTLDKGKVVPRDNALRQRLRLREDLDTDIDQNTSTRARAPEPETAPGDAHRWRGLAMRFFSKAYEVKRNDAWMQGGYFGPDFDRICRACKTESDIETGIKNFFAMADSYVVQEDYSPRILAKNWNKYRNPPKPSVVSAKPLADNSRWHESNRAAWVYDRFDQPPPGCDSARLWWEHHENNRIREAS